MTQQCVNCPGAEDHSTAQCPVMAEASAVVNQQVTAADSLPVGVPDGWALVRHEAIEYLADQWPGAYRTFYAIAVDSAAAGPTVKAEQAPTPEFVWVRLLEALAGDNGCPFTASTDDYREAKPALVQLIAAGLFRDDADSLDGDIWTIAAGEQSEAAARFASCADAYAVLSDVLNRVFERPDEAPSLPAAGSAELIAEAERCLFVLREIGSMDADDITGDDVDLRFEDEEGCDTGCDVSIVDYAEKSADVIEKMIAALSAQQSAQPEFCCEHSYKVAKQAAWGARDLTQCKCDHNEYCEHCWPDDFREGGKWHGGFETKQSAQDDEYPPCDYCGVVPDYHPWHGSGAFRGVENPHIHACNDCRHLLPTAQSAPERVSVPVELLERVCWPVASGSDRHTHSEAVAELRALLASHGRGEA